MIIRIFYVRSFYVYIGGGWRCQVKILDRIVGGIRRRVGCQPGVNPLWSRRVADAHGKKIKRSENERWKEEEKNKANLLAFLVLDITSLYFDHPWQGGKEAIKVWLLEIIFNYLYLGKSPILQGTYDCHHSRSIWLNGLEKFLNNLCMNT